MLPLVVQSALVAPYARELRIPAIVSETLSILTDERLLEAAERVKEVAKDFLSEVGVRDVAFEEAVAGFYKPVVVDRWGRRLSIESAPSGIRESILIPLVLAASEGAALFIEEIEAHLHPRALYKLIKFLVGEAVERRSFVAFTTHSPVTLSSLNNALLELELSSVPAHELVSVVHLVDDEGGVRGTEIPVREDGFDESALGEIYRELMEERARLEEALGV